jgi:outer membrane lipoprotein SlyB
MPATIACRLSASAQRAATRACFDNNNIRKNLMDAHQPTPSPSPSPSRTGQHPLLIAAAIAVILFCLIATAAIMGWIPSTLSSSASPKLSDADRLALSSKMQQQDDAAAVAAVAVTPAPLAAMPAPAPLSSPSPVPAVVQESPVVIPAPVAKAAPERAWCANCGNIESIRQITTRAHGSGLGAGAGAVLGGLLGNQIGSGHGRQLATVAGAVGGAVVGNQVEGNMNANHSYEIRVRLDNGKHRTFHQRDISGWHDGDRVRIVNNGLRAVG